MNPTQFWKNFRLGEELDVAGAFIYNGVRRFHELRKLDNTSDLFEVFYNLSVGLERLLKIAIVLVEHKDGTDQDAFEKSLITHSHQTLVARLQEHVPLNLGASHNDFLVLLARFYKQVRYGRFSVKSAGDFHRERRELCAFLAKHLPGVTFSDDPGIFGVENDARYKKFLRNTVLKFSTALYETSASVPGNSTFIPMS